MPRTGREALAEIMGQGPFKSSGRLGLSVRTWLAEAATAADLKGRSGGAKPPQEKKFKLVFGCLNLGESTEEMCFVE